MQVEVNGFNGNLLVVRRDISDMRCRSDSHFLYRVKLALIAKGYDCIKKLAWKDGHLVDNYMHYIRSRKGSWCIYDPNYTIRSIAEKFNKEGEVTLFIDGRIE